MAEDTKIEIVIDPIFGARARKKVVKQSKETGEKSGESFSKGFKRTSKDVISKFNPFSSILGKVSAIGATLGAAFAGKGIVSAGVQIEKIETQFATLLGSTGAAQKQIQDLVNFAAKTPFQLEGLADSTAKLLAFGFAQEEVGEKLKILGDIASGSGSDIGEISRIFGQVRAAGKLTGERLLQLEERAINVAPVLAKNLGVAESSIRTLVSQGKIGFADLDKAFQELTASGGKFANATIKQSQTLGGLISTFKDNFFALQVSLAKVFGPVLKRSVALGIEQLQSLTNFIKSNSKTIIVSFFSIARGINDFIVAPLIKFGQIGEVVFRSMVVGINTLVAGFGKLGGAAGKLIQFFNKDSGLAQGLIDFSETSQIVLEESIKPLSDTINSLFEPSKITENIDMFIAEMERAVSDVEPPLNDLSAKVDVNNKKLVTSFQKTGKQIANAINQALVKSTSLGIQSLTKSLVLGADGFANFGKQIFGILGDLSIKLGESLILTGIGIESLKALSGAAAIAAGAGLIALGTILKSFSGGSGGLSPGATNGVGGGFGTPTSENDFSEGFEDEREEPQTAVNVNIQGDVLDSDETGTRIAQIISDSFDRDDIVVKRGAFA
jgi:tape measure domain-containing protein